MSKIHLGTVGGPRMQRQKTGRQMKTEWWAGYGDD